MEKLTRKQTEWLIKQNMIYPILCKMCPMPVKWHAPKGRYNTYCSTKCYHKDKDYTNTLRRQTTLNNCGVENPSHSQLIRERTKKTNLERYGHENIAHGTLNKKVKQTMLERYGHENASCSEIVKTKKKQTTLKNYGVENPLLSEEIRKKIRQINLERYGSIYPNQQHMLSAVLLLENYNWLYKNYIIDNKSTTHIATELGVNHTTVGDYLAKHNIPATYGYQYSYSCILWLEQTMEREKIYIQHALNDGEYRIPGTNYRADGYCAKTNTVYEFYGDYWHGNLNRYAGNYYNCILNLTMKEIYQKTIEREKSIKELGYNLVIMWESDFT